MSGEFEIPSADSTPTSASTTQSSTPPEAPTLPPPFLYGADTPSPRSFPQPRPRKPDYGQLGDVGGRSFPQMMIPISTSSSGSGSGDFVGIGSPVYPPTNQHLARSHSMPMRLFGGANQSPLPAMAVPPEVAPLIESVRVEAEQQIAATRSECDAKIQLARVRVAELEERLRVAENEGDTITMQMTMMEVQKAEAERTRDSAVNKLEELLALIKDSGGQDTYVKWLESELKAAKAANGNQSNQSPASSAGSQPPASTTQQGNAEDTAESQAPQNEESQCSEPPIATKGTPEPRPPTNEKFKPSRGHKSDEALLGEILAGLQQDMAMEEAVHVAAGVRSTKQFIAQAYLRGIKSQEEQEREIVENFVAQFASITVDPNSLLDSVIGVSRQLGTLRKTVADADATMASYTAALVRQKAATAKQLYDAVSKGAGKKPGKKIAVMMAHALKQKVGEKHAANIINSKGGLRMGHVEGLEWLQTEAHSPEESDYCTDSRSASDTD